MSDKTNSIIVKILALLGMTFIFGLGFLFAFHLDTSGKTQFNEIDFWQSQLIAFLILSMNFLIEPFLNNLCYNKNKKENDSK